MTDVIDRTARQVRAFGSPVLHRLSTIRTGIDGRIYRTVCGAVYTGAGALLSTGDATCRQCGGPRQ